jgi:hypothetical protein
MDQNEEVLPIITSTEFGTDSTGYGTVIKNIAPCLQRCKMCVNKNMFVI